MPALPDEFGWAASRHAFFRASDVPEGVTLLAALRIEHNFSPVASFLRFDEGVVSVLVRALVFDNYNDDFLFFFSFSFGRGRKIGRINTHVIALVERELLVLALLFQALVLLGGPEFCLGAALGRHALVVFVRPFFVFFRTCLNTTFVLDGPALFLCRALERYAEVLLFAPDLVPFRAL